MVDRLLIEDVECQSLSDGRWLDVMQGDRFALAAARFEDVTIPGKAGRTPGVEQPDELPIKIRGPVWGEGGTPAAARAMFAESMIELRDALANDDGSVGKIVTITAYKPNMALATGESATIAARVLRILIPDPQGWEQSYVEIELVCVSNPPRWSVSEAS